MYGHILCYTTFLFSIVSNNHTFRLCDIGCISCFIFKLRLAMFLLQFILDIIYYWYFYFKTLLVSIMSNFVTLGNSVTSVHDIHFYFCYFKTMWFIMYVTFNFVTLGNSVTSVYEIHFYFCYFKTMWFIMYVTFNFVTLGNSVTSVYDIHFYFCYFKTMVIHNVCHV